MNNNWIEQLHTLPKWKKYSQAHEEAYLDHILSNIESKNKHIVEFGAWDGFHLSNTRYFIEDKGYTALLIDGDNHGNEEVKQHFIDAENVLQILSQYDTPYFFDLLCIDLDGNDYYILQNLLPFYRPSVIIAEFNPIFDPTQAYAIKYNPSHTWNNDDYYGFSFKAGIELASSFGYICVFQNDNLNMYFVADEVLAHSLGVGQAWIRDHVPPVHYTPTHYHPVSNRTDWIKL